MLRRVKGNSGRGIFSFFNFNAIHRRYTDVRVYGIIQNDPSGSK